MAVIVLASASGSPGVSTTALGLTLNWHRPVLLVDADPTGSSSVFAGYFPTDISSIAIAHALVAGNTVVWKPSEYAPRSCALVAELAEQAGLPAGVLNVVQGLGDAGAALVECDVDGIFFTGSTATGIKIAEKAGLKKLLLELGGDGPQIVLEDADVDAAVEGAVTGSFYLAGQVCTSAERILVHKDVYDEFLAKFQTAVTQLKIGDPFDDATDMGPMCNEASLGRVRAHVADAVAKGAKVFQHGDEKGNFYPATILTNVSPDSEVMHHETFGPVVPVIRIESAQDAIDMANASGMGLVASLWTRDLAQAWRVAEALPHGAVNINETSNYWDQLAPFGGAGKSGVGRELATNFFDTFMEPKLLVFDLGTVAGADGAPLTLGDFGSRSSHVGHRRSGPLCLPHERAPIANPVVTIRLSCIACDAPAPQRLRRLPKLHLAVRTPRSRRAGSERPGRAKLSPRMKPRLPVVSSLDC